MLCGTFGFLQNIEHIYTPAKMLDRKLMYKAQPYYSHRTVNDSFKNETGEKGSHLPWQ